MLKNQKSEIRNQKSAAFTLGGTSGRDHDHRHLDRAVVAGSAGGARGGKKSHSAPTTCGSWPWACTITVLRTASCPLAAVLPTCGVLRRAFNWRMFIFPEIEQTALYDDIKSKVVPDFVSTATPSNAWVGNS